MGVPRRLSTPLLRTPYDASFITKKRVVAPRQMMSLLLISKGSDIPRSPGVPGILRPPTSWSDLSAPEMTRVPLVELRSAINHRVPSRQMRAWLRETSGSTSAMVWGPGGQTAEDGALRAAGEAVDGRTECAVDKPDES